VVAVAALAVTALGLTAPMTAAASTTQYSVASGVSAQALPPYRTWIADVTKVTDQAAAYLQTRLPDPARRTAIVLDIDNTALEAGYNPGVTSPATAPVLAVARQAKAAGAAVFFVTARPSFLRLLTQFNLTTEGYTVDGLYMRSSGSIQTSKTNARRAIERRRYTIVANIGNLNTDLAGGHAERTFKLPDYNGQLS
jgi:HAD superfamily, subfamily IIIB (Acid phosphatase)